MVEQTFYILTKEEKEILEVANDILKKLSRTGLNLLSGDVVIIESDKLCTAIDVLYDISSANELKTHRKK